MVWIDQLGVEGLDLAQSLLVEVSQISQSEFFKSLAGLDCYFKLRDLRRQSIDVGLFGACRN